MIDLKSLTIADIHSAFLSGKFTCTDLVKECLSNISRENEKLNAYLSVNDENALKLAKEVDEKIKKGEKLLSLEGIPFGVKDIFAVKGLRCTNASNITKSMVAVYDAETIKRLKDAGAIVIGKENLDQFACGASTETSAFGPVLNPYNPEYVAGGSSGGSACSVSKSMSVFSVGTDTGGSIRQPASFCNVVGLKVTYGRVSRFGITSMASSWDTVGHFTNSVKDSAEILKITAGVDGLDATLVDEPVPDYIESLNLDVKGLRVGVPAEYFEAGIDEEVKNAVRLRIAKLKELGAEIVDVSLPTTKYGLAVYYVTMPTELSANLGRFDGVRFGSKPTAPVKDLYEYYCMAREEGFSDEIKRRIMVGTFVSSAGCIDAFYVKAQKVRTVIINEFMDVFKKVDVLIAPVSPVKVFKVGSKSNDPIAMYMADALLIPASAAGLPAISIPSGFDTNGLPIGTQIIAPHFREDLLFRVGSKLENI